MEIGGIVEYYFRNNYTFISNELGIIRNAMFCIIQWWPLYFEKSEMDYLILQRNSETFIHAHCCYVY